MSSFFCDKDKISIIVPVYKVEQQISKCLDSILAQIYKTFVMILIDDGSPDKCPTICEGYAQIDSRICIVHQTNSGVSSARNTGLDIANGEWISFVDSDDWILPNYLQALCSVIHQNSLVVGNYYICDDNINLKESEQIKNDHFSLKDKEHNFINELLAKAKINTPWVKLFSLKIIRENKICFPISMSYGEDRVFVMRYLLNVKTIEAINEFIYVYMRYSTNKTLSNFWNRRIVNDYRKVISEESNFLMKYQSPNEVESTLSIRWQNVFFRFLNMIDQNSYLTFFQKIKEMFFLFSIDNFHVAFQYQYYNNIHCSFSIYLLAKGYFVTFIIYYFFRKFIDYLRCIIM